MTALTREQSRQVGALTAGALALFIGFRMLPTGTNLNHMDFRLSGGNVIEFCDPSNPQFLPVVAVRSPVVLAVRPDSPVRTGAPARLRITLATSAGKPIGPQELVVAHTRKLHLMVVDPTLADYQHVHPEPGEAPGEWVVDFQPRLSGTYRVFADFTPAATNRGLYASTDLEVAPGAPGTGMPFAGADAPRGYRFSLVPSGPVRAGLPADLVFGIVREGGGAVPLEPVMGAFAHLVAFDPGRSGFAHLHPAETDITRPPDAENPRLTFKVTIPKPGRYVIWAQVSLGGTEAFVPFTVEVGL